MKQVMALTFFLRVAPQAATLSLRKLHFLLFLLIGFGAFAGEGLKERTPDYNVKKTVKDTKIATTKSVIRFTVHSGYSTNKGQTVTYSVDGSSQFVQLTKEYFEITVKPGDHTFQFFYGENFYEIYTAALSFKGGYRTYIDLNFRRSEHEIMIEKPVIYLYPEQELAVNVQLAPAGELQFTYPPYSDGWNISAAPDGTISQNGKTYPYLFWDAKTPLDSQSFDVRKGFVVGKDQVITFLEEKLTAIGLNEKEQTDFITYWGPRLAANDRSFVQFAWGAAADTFGKLTVSPRPDQLNRLYIVWSPLDATTILSPEAQELPVFDRSGFDVLEWGGSEIPLSFIALTALR